MRSVSVEVRDRSGLGSGPKYLWKGCRACVESSLFCTAEPTAALPTVATLWIG
jgi:hypothetical protein